MKKNNDLCAILNSHKNFKELEPLSYNRPVAAMPFACRYRVIDFMLSNISNANIDSVALFIDTSGRSIYDHIRGARDWNLNTSQTGGIFTFSQQEWKRQRFMEGKHGGEDFYENHRTFMRRSKAKYVVVMSGEYIANVDIDALVDFYHESEGDIATVFKKVPASKIQDYQDLNFLEVEENGRVISCPGVDECTINGLVNLDVEVFVLKIDTMNEIFDRAIEDEYYEDIGSVIHKYLMNYDVVGYEYTGYSAIVDSIDTYYQCNMDMLDSSNFNSLFHSSLPIITRTKNGTPTFYAVGSKISRSLCATGCDVYGTVDESLLFRNVLVEENAVVSNSIILPGGKIGKGANISYAILDKGVKVDEGVEIVGTPEHIVVIPKNEHVTKEWGK